MTKKVISIEVNDSVLIASRAFLKLYNHPESGLGGYGHIVFEDGNFDCVGACIQDCKLSNLEYLYPEEVRVLSLEALEAFSVLSEEEMQMAIWISTPIYPNTPFRVV
jgi:hypothetical protein